MRHSEAFACPDAKAYLAVLLGLLEGRESHLVIPLWGQGGDAIPFDSKDWEQELLRAQQLLAGPTESLFRAITAAYEPDDEETIVVSYDSEPEWFLQALFWAVVTRRRCLEWPQAPQMEVSDRKRQLFVGSPKIPLDVLGGYFPAGLRRVPGCLVSAEPALLSKLLMRTLQYTPAKKLTHGNCVFHMDSSDAMVKKQHTLYSQAGSVDTRLTQGGHVLFVYGHSREDHFLLHSLALDSVVLCGAQQRVPRNPFPGTEVPPCHYSGKCFVDTIPVALLRKNKRSYIRRLEDLNFTHYALVGCRTFCLDTNSYGPFYDLALGAIAGGAVSYIGGYSFLEISTNQTIFLHMLLQSGLSIGEALDIYTEWAIFSSQGWGSLRFIGDPTIRYVEQTLAPSFQLEWGANTCVLEEERTTMRCHLADQSTPTTEGIALVITSPIDVPIYYAVVPRLNMTEIWVYGAQPFPPGAYVITVQKYQREDLINWITDVPERARMLEYFKLLTTQESHTSLKHLQNELTQLTHLLLNGYREPIGKALPEAINDVEKGLYQLQKSILQPLAYLMQEMPGDPSSHYSTLCIYQEERIMQCSKCNTPLLSSFAQFPGLSQGQRIFAQCIVCDERSDRPASSQIQLDIQVFEETSNNYRVDLVITNNGSRSATANIVGIIEMGRYWNATVEPSWVEIQVPGGKSVAISLHIYSPTVPPGLMQIFRLLSLIDLEWFYYFKSLPVHRIE